MGWVLTLWGIGSWGHRAGAWCVLESVALLGAKWILEDHRRQKWITRLYLEGELKTLGEFSLAGMRSNLLDESSDGGERSLGGLSAFQKKKKLSDPFSDPEGLQDSPPEEEHRDQSMISDWIFGDGRNKTGDNGSE